MHYFQSDRVPHLHVGRPLSPRGGAYWVLASVSSLLFILLPGVSSISGIAPSQKVVQKKLSCFPAS